MQSKVIWREASEMSSRTDGSSRTDARSRSRAPLQNSSSAPAGILTSADGATRKRSHRFGRKGQKPEQEQGHKFDAKMAEVAMTMKTVNDQSREVGASARNGGSVVALKTGQVIPWYILDPTGLLIREQRSDSSTKMQLDPTAGDAARRAARFLVRWPTLYPWWDAVTAIALVFTALVTPYEVGFLPPATNPWNALWLVNRVIDLVFIFDMLFQIFTMRKMEVAKAVEARAEWEMSLRVIARQYFCSVWFLLDIASVAPSGMEIAPMIIGDAGRDEETSSGLRSLRTMRSLRLIKLLRLAKSSRVSVRAMEFVSLSSTSQTAIGLTFQSLLLTHWFACILMIATTFSPSPRSTW